jgi:hypothetical protein
MDFTRLQCPARPNIFNRDVEFGYLNFAAGCKIFDVKIYKTEQGRIDSPLFAFDVE